MALSLTAVSHTLILGGRFTFLEMLLIVSVYSVDMHIRLAEKSTQKPFKVTSGRVLGHKGAVTRFELYPHQFSSINLWAQTQGQEIWTWIILCLGLGRMMSEWHRADQEQLCMIIIIITKAISFADTVDPYGFGRSISQSPPREIFLSLARAGFRC